MKLTHAEKDYFALLGLAGAFSVMLIIRGELFWLIGALVLIMLAVIRKRVKV